MSARAGKLRSVRECCAGGSRQAVREAMMATFVCLRTAEGVKLRMKDRGVWRMAVIVLCETRGFGDAEVGSRRWCRELRASVCLSVGRSGHTISLARCRTSPKVRARGRQCQGQKCPGLENMFTARDRHTLGVGEAKFPGCYQLKPLGIGWWAAGVCR